MKGSEWWRDEVPEELGDDYTFAILEAINDGHAVLDWITVVDGDLEFEIMRAPLAIGEHSDSVFLLGLSNEAVDMIAKALENRGLVVMSPTPALWDRASEDPRQAQIGPHTLPSLLGVPNGAAGMTKTAAKAHADAIEKSRPESCSFISAACKTYVLHPYAGAGSRRESYGCEYGWRLPGKVGWGSKAETGSGYVVQPAAWAHFYRQFWDYSTGAIFVKRAARHLGKPVDLGSMALRGATSPAVTSAGAVPYIRSPECRKALAPPSGPDTSPAPPPSTASRPVLSRGSKGAAVGDWQRILMSDGYSLAPWNDDEDFGPATEGTTKKWQQERGLEPTGVVDGATWDAVGTEPKEPPRTDLEVKSYPAKNFTPAKRTSVDVVVIHTAEAIKAETTADRVAWWMGGRYTKAPRASYHYISDINDVWKLVEEENVAWAAPGCNHNGIQVSHAGYARQTTEEWFDPYNRRMLALSAKLVAGICERWDIPVRFVDAAGLKRGERGITTHYQVSLGPGKGRTNHTDPGRGFPMSTYLEMIRKEMSR